MSSLANEQVIPCMGGTRIGPTLARLARETPPEMAIVEVGCWLGAGTWQLATEVAKKAVPNPIHSFDRFTSSQSEVKKAEAYGLRLRAGQDTRKIVQGFLTKAGAPVNLHKGRLQAFEWHAGPIGLYIDDAAKTEDLFRGVLRCFGPDWIPGVTTIALMDFHYWEKHKGTDKEERFKFQSRFFNENTDHFRPINWADPAGTTAAFFKYTKRYDFGSVSLPARRKFRDYFRKKTQVTARPRLGDQMSLNET